MRSSTFSSHVEAAWSSVSRRWISSSRTSARFSSTSIDSSQRPSRTNKRLEGRERAEVRRIDRDHAAPCIDRFVDAAEHVTFELTELCVQLDRLVLADRARQLTDVDDAADGLAELVPRLRGAIQPRQRAQRLEVVAVDADVLVER